MSLQPRHQATPLDFDPGGGVTRQNGYTPAMLARRHNHDDLARTIKRVRGFGGRGWATGARSPEGCSPPPPASLCHTRARPPLLLYQDYNLCRRGWVLQLLHLVTTGRARIADGRYELPAHHLQAPAAPPPRKSSGEKRVRAELVGTSPPPASPAIRRRCAAGLPPDATTRASVTTAARGTASGAGTGAGAGAGAGHGAGSGEGAGSGTEEIPRLPPPPHASHRGPAREDSVLRRLRALRHKRASSVSSGSGSDAESRPTRGARARSGSAAAGGRSSRGRELRRRWSVSSAAVPMPPAVDRGSEETAQAAEALVRMAALVPDLQMYIIKML